MVSESPAAVGLADVWGMPGAPSQLLLDDGAPRCRQVSTFQVSGQSFWGRVRFRLPSPCIHACPSSVQSVWRLLLPSNLCV